MGAPTIINKFGKVIGWNSVTFNILGRDVEGIQEIEYNDNIDVEAVYGAGKYPIGYGEGNYEATCSFMLTEEERRAILEALPQGTRLQEIAPTTAIVAYDYNGKIYKDKINNVVMKNNGVAVKQGDKTIGFKFECFITHIDWNN